MILALKYRPKTLQEVKGNEELVTTLDSMLNDKESCPHSFLLTGPTGCGKTTIGRIIATRLNCFGSDLREIDSADFRGIDTIRDIRKNSQFMPLESDCRVWILDEVQQLTKDAQSALLKILEDTPPHIYFVLCTTDPQNLLPTLKGRCSLFTVQPLNPEIMYGLLRRIVRSEGEILDKEIYDQIISGAEGLVRNAVQNLQQVLESEPDQRLTVAKQAEERRSQTIELCRTLLKKESWKKVSSILEGLKEEKDVERIRRAVLGYCQSVVLKGGEIDRCGLIMEEFIEPFWNSGFPALVLACLRIVKS